MDNFTTVETGIYYGTYMLRTGLQDHCKMTTMRCGQLVGVVLEILGPEVVWVLFAQ